MRKSSTDSHGDLMQYVYTITHFRKDVRIECDSDGKKRNKAMEDAVTSLENICKKAGGRGAGGITWLTGGGWRAYVVGPAYVYNEVGYGPLLQTNVICLKGQEPPQLMAALETLYGRPASVKEETGCVAQPALK